MRVLFVGCGQIGGSLLLRAREMLPQARLVVCDREAMRATIEASGACDAWVNEPELAVPGCGVIVIGTPLDDAPPMLLRVLDSVGEDAVVIDVMSLKGGMHAAARKHENEDRYVGGHPMFGSEASGFAAANPAWVEDAPFILTRTEHTGADAFIRARDFVQSLGARPIERDPVEHDKQLARVSHLPQALASLLMDLAGEDPDSLEVHGPGFRDMTRLALSAPEFWAEVFAGNAGELRPLLERFAADVRTFAERLDQAGPVLQRAREKKRATPRLAQGTLASRVAESSTGAMLRRVVALKEQGHDVIGLHVGEPKLPPSAKVSALVRDALAKAPIVYTPTAGSSALRERVARIASEVTRREVTPEHTIVTVGAKQALHLALASLVAPGDEVIVVQPSWVSFAETVRLAGGNVAYASSLDHVVLGPRTRAIILNTPNNPTGEVYGEERLRRVLDACAKAGVWLISDELYRTLVFEGVHVSPAALYDEDRTVWLDGIAKSHAMTGLRIGYAAGPRALIQKMTKLASHETSCASSVSQAAAVALLDAFPHGDPALLNDVRSLRSRVQMWAKPGVLASPMQGGFYAWLDVRAMGASSSRVFSERVLEEARVATMPGDAFGAPGYLRLSYAVPANELELAFLRLSKM